MELSKHRDSSWGMIKKTPKQQKTEKSEDPTISPVSTPDTAVPSSLTQPEEESAQATRPTPPTRPTPTPPTRPTPVVPSNNNSPPQVVTIKKAGEIQKVGERNSRPSSDVSSERQSGRRPIPAPTKAPAKLTECGKYKAGDEIVLPYSGKTVAWTYFYKSANPEEFWGVFEGGCVRLSALP